MTGIADRAEPSAAHLVTREARARIGTYTRAVGNQPRTSCSSNSA